MATKTIRVDDFDGKTEEGVKEVSFSLEGDRYSIDLGPDSLKALKDALNPFIKKASKGAAPAAGTSKRPGALAWAKEQGLVSPTHRGKLPAAANEAYDAAH